MSAQTGDKARFNRNRKRKAAKRLLARPIRVTVVPPVPAPVDPGKA